MVTSFELDSFTNGPKDPAATQHRTPIMSRKESDRFHMALGITILAAIPIIAAVTIAGLSGTGSGLLAGLKFKLPAHWSTLIALGAAAIAAFAVITVFLIPVVLFAGAAGAATLAGKGYHRSWNTQQA